MGYENEKIQIMLRLNWITLGMVFDQTNGATLVFSNKNRVKVTDLQKSNRIGVKIKDKTIYYKIEGGDVIGEFNEEFMRNYSKVRVLTYWECIEEFEGSDLEQFCVSRNIEKETSKGMEKYIYKQCEVTKDEIAKAGTVEALRAEIAKKIEEAKKAQANKFRTDGYLQYLNEFRGLYREMALRQEKLAEVSIAAIATSIVAAIAGLIALIVTAV